MTKNRVIGGTVGCFLFVFVVAVALGSAMAISGWFTWNWLPWGNDDTTVVIETPAQAPTPAKPGTSDDPVLADAQPGTGTPAATTPTPVPTGTVPLGTASGGGGGSDHKDPNNKLFICEEATRPPFYPEELQRLTSGERQKLKIPNDAVARRFRFPNNESALGQWAEKHNLLPNKAFDEEILLIGVIPTQVCFDAQGSIKHKTTTIRDGVCVHKDDNSLVLGATIKTLCKTPNGEFVTYGDLLSELDVKWGKSKELGDGVWAYCDPEGRRPDPASGYPGACRKGTTKVATDVR